MEKEQIEEVDLPIILVIVRDSEERFSVVLVNREAKDHRAAQSGWFDTPEEAMKDAERFFNDVMDPAIIEDLKKQAIKYNSELN